MTATREPMTVEVTELIVHGRLVWVRAKRLATGSWVIDNEGLFISRPTREAIEEAAVNVLPRLDELEEARAEVQRMEAALRSLE